jgi:tellurite resistance protein
MTEFQFNCMTTTNRIMANANRQHYLSVHKAKGRIEARDALRQLKQQRREATLDLAVRVAIAIGIVATGWFLTAIFGN